MLHSIRINKFRQFENVDIQFGKYITCIAGFNGTGKSTIMGLTGNSMMLSSRKIKTLLNKPFNIEFKDIFKGSPKFDPTKAGVCTVSFSSLNNENEIIGERTSRITWQDHGKRFRIIPEWYETDPITSKTVKKSSKYPMATFYLGLSRLYPIGETADDEMKVTASLLTLTQKEKFLKAYNEILSLNDSPMSFEVIKIPKASNKVSIGISTDKYDFLANSSGQDNLSQIILSALSFERGYEMLKDEWKGGVLFIDEIDCTLHPAAQMKLCDFLYEEAKQYKFQVVFTTHSYSLLNYLISKTVYNNDNQINNYQLIYLTNANGELEIIRNPSSSLIESDLFMKPSEPRKVQILCEDRANREFLRSLLHNYLEYVKIEEDINIGCNEAEHLYNLCPSVFSNMLFVLDGDVSHNEALSYFIQKDNVLILPSEDPPDKLIFNYLISTSKLENFNIEQGFTKRNIEENGPNSRKYEREQEERRKYSCWFFDNKRLILENHSFSYWCEENEELTAKFVKHFIKKYNRIAKQIGGKIIKPIQFDS